MDTKNDNPWANPTSGKLETKQIQELLQEFKNKFNQKYKYTIEDDNPLCADFDVIGDESLHYRSFRFNLIRKYPDRNTDDEYNFTLFVVRCGASDFPAFIESRTSNSESDGQVENYSELNKKVIEIVSSDKTGSIIQSLIDG